MNSTIFAWIDGPALFFVAVCAVFYLNERHYHLSNFRCIAVVMVAGCALGRSFAYFWPGNHEALIEWLRLGIDAGLAAIFAAMAWGRVQEMFGESPMKTFHRDALELAVHARTSEEYEMVRMAAAAALRQDGIDRRVGRQDDASEIELEAMHKRG